MPKKIFSITPWLGRLFYYIPLAIRAHEEQLLGLRLRRQHEHTTRDRVDRAILSVAARQRNGARSERRQLGTDVVHEEGRGLSAKAPLMPQLMELFEQRPAIVGREGIVDVL